RDRNAECCRHRPFGKLSLPIRRPAMTSIVQPHPIAVIGAGPIGLAAAVHLHRRGLETRVYEAGRSVGAAIREWGHVRMFSSWAYSLDPECVALLEASGWVSPAL